MNADNCCTTRNESTGATPFGVSYWFYYWFTPPAALVGREVLVH
jgi:hypothetical protein